MTATITTPVTFLATDQRLIRGAWGFDPRDPLAVRLVLWAPGQPMQPWCLSRELLGDAFLRLAGVGDVVMQVRHGLLVVDLRSPDGRLVLTCDAELVREFLGRTREAVPQCCSGGSERLRLAPAVCANPECVECRAVQPALDRWLTANRLSAREIKESRRERLAE